MADIVWEGAKEFQQWLRETPNVAVRDVEAALMVEGEQIMGVSKRATPVDTGNLRGTGHVKIPKTAGGVTTVVLAYGTDYAIYVHEMIYLSHKNGWAKFLEGACMAAQEGFGNRMKKRVLDKIGGRGGW